ncbi:hypothetical protein [Isoptericola jiangsuensis]|uniref:hypothetical protein n=1 Tax=Isoptericola jiangsuensis TaxID=548579 RepID=UPI001474A222|nr:hypothetical protein [Isoptericola jiangsuensis]
MASVFDQDDAKRETARPPDLAPWLGWKGFWRAERPAQDLDQSGQRKNMARLSAATAWIAT